MDTNLALTTLKDNLNSNLTDLYVTAGGKVREQYIYYNQPISSPKYPIIEIKKVDNPESVLTIGPNFTTSEYVYANLWVYSKNGFKVVVDGTTYLNTSLVEYLMTHIKDTIKSQFSTLHTEGIIVKSINTSQIIYDPVTQLYFAAVSIMIWFFGGGC